jgi:uncharacterized protein
MSQAAKAQEPSMEEILASIRRIIADDEAAKPAKAPEPVAAAPAPPPPRPVAPPPPKPIAEFKPPIPAVPAPSETADVLDLTEAMAAPASVPPPAAPPPAFRTIDAESDVVFSDRPHEPEPVPVIEEARRQFAAAAPDRSLLSNTTMAAVDSAFNSLANTVLGNNARTLEDLVKEMLRPMLKSWLDDNLPGLVERIVRAEIERVSRGR